MLRGSVFISLVILLILCRAASAQELAPTEWEENVSANANGLIETESGADDFLPEPVDLTVSIASAEISGSVTPGLPGPPSGTAELEATAAVGDADLTGLAGFAVSFQLRVVETSPPPVTVVRVPLTAAAQGSVYALGDEWIRITATSGVNLYGVSGLLLNATAVASTDLGDTAPPENSFDATGQANFDVDEIVLGQLSALVALGTNGADAGAASGYAFVDPVIQVADELIPGTSANYRDHFTIEYGSGYGYLPVERVSWGDVKTLYEDR